MKTITFEGLWDVKIPLQKSYKQTLTQVASSRQVPESKKQETEATCCAKDRYKSSV